MGSPSLKCFICMRQVKEDSSNPSTKFSNEEKSFILLQILELPKWHTYLEAMKGLNNLGYCQECSKSVKDFQGVLEALEELEKQVILQKTVIESQVRRGWKETWKDVNPGQGPSHTESSQKSPDDILLDRLKGEIVNDLKASSIKSLLGKITNGQVGRKSPKTENLQAMSGLNVANIPVIHSASQPGSFHDSGEGILEFIPDSVQNSVPFMCSNSAQGQGQQTSEENEFIQIDQEVQGDEDFNPYPDTPEIDIDEIDTEMKYMPDVEFSVVEEDEVDDSLEEEGEEMLAEDYLEDEQADGYDEEELSLLRRLENPIPAPSPVATASTSNGYIHVRGNPSYAASCSSSSRPNNSGGMAEYECGACYLCFETFEDLTKHNIRHRNEKKDYSNSTPNLAKARNINANHLKMKTYPPLPPDFKLLVPKEEDEDRLPCLSCERTYANQKSLARHMKLAHTPDSSSTSDKKKFKCTLCNFSSKSNKGLLIHTTWIHIKKENKIVETIMNTNASTKTKTQTKPNTKDILEQGEQNGGSGSDNHIKIKIIQPKIIQVKEVKKKTSKTSKKQYQCYLCPMSFNFGASLKIHLLKHTGDKAFKCDQCEASFFSKTSLIRHGFNHTEKPFPCGICEKRFTLRSGLKSHIEGVHEGKRKKKKKKKKAKRH